MATAVPKFPHCFGAGFNPTYSGSSYTCGICMVDTTVNEEESNNHLAHFNGCAHTACVSCLTTWMESGRRDCPVCRRTSDGIQTVSYTLYMANQEHMLLEEDIGDMQQHIEDRTKMNTLLRLQLVADNEKIERVVGRFGHYGCNDYIMAVDTMEDIAGISSIPHHVRDQGRDPEVFKHADMICKISENEMSLKTDMIQKNTYRTAYEIDQIKLYKQRQIHLAHTAQMLLSGYSLPTEESIAMDVENDVAMDVENDVAIHLNFEEEEEEEEEEESEEEEEEEGIGCNICYSCVTGGAGPCVLERTSLSVTPGPSSTG